MNRRQLLLLAIGAVLSGNRRAAAAGELLEVETIPRRPPGAPSGSEFARRTAGMSGRERQQAALAELRSGNVPDFLRRLHPVDLDRETEADGAAPGPMRTTIWVMSDYLSIGSDDDYLRIPLTLPSTIKISQLLRLLPPTRKMVDAIYDQAEVKLSPQPLPPGPRMRSSEYYLRHDRMIREQQADHPPGLLVSGHKKDVVLTNRLRRLPGRIAIYGWHRSQDDPIQPLSTVHGASYADYSHGLRLVDPQVWIDGRPLPLVETLADPALSYLLSYEGPMLVPPGLRQIPTGEPGGARPGAQPA